MNKDDIAREAAVWLSELEQVEREAGPLIEEENTSPMMTQFEKKMLVKLRKLFDKPDPRIEFYQQHALHRLNIDNEVWTVGDDPKVSLREKGAYVEVFRHLPIDEEVFLAAARDLMLNDLSVEEWMLEAHPLISLHGEEGAYVSFWRWVPSADIECQGCYEMRPVNNKRLCEQCAGDAP